MSSLDELIQKARALQDDGHPVGQIADELSLSTDTITWLLTQGTSSDKAAPKDVHIDWTVVSSDANLLNGVAQMLMVNFEAQSSEEEEVDAAVGLSVTGVPLATLIAAEHGLNLAIYYPSKHNPEGNVGSISGNFSKVAGKRCVIIDDCITTGNSLAEAVVYLRKHKANPVGICVLFDKRGVREIEGVPVYPLFNVKRID